jgi:hypothetical protein
MNDIERLRKARNDCNDAIGALRIALIPYKEHIRILNGKSLDELKISELYTFTRFVLTMHEHLKDQ